MTRAVWKGPFVDGYLIKKAQKVSDSGRKEVIKTWSRRSTIIPQFVGLTFGVYNGQKFVPVTVSEQMVGHKLGEFSPTRSFKGHTAADKKAEQKMTDKLIATAKDNMLRISPLKLSLIANSIVNKKVSNAVNQLKFSNKRIASSVLKVLNSAVANAENNNQLDIDKLFIKQAFVGKSLRMKRWRPRAKGRAASIIKPFSKLTIVVEERVNSKEDK